MRQLLSGVRGSNKMQTIQGLAEEVPAEEIQINAEVGGEVLQRTGMAEMQRCGDQA